MASESSFDIVSKVDRQEVDNALNQAAKEISQRFDFRGTNASIEWSGELGVTIKADTEVTLATIPEWNFRSFLKEHPEVAWRLLEELSRRVRQAEGCP